MTPGGLFAELDVHLSGPQLKHLRTPGLGEGTYLTHPKKIGQLGAFFTKNIGAFFTKNITLICHVTLLLKEEMTEIL